MEKFKNNKIQKNEIQKIKNQNLKMKNMKMKNLEIKKEWVERLEAMDRATKKQCLVALYQYLCDDRRDVTAYDSYPRAVRVFMRWVHGSMHNYAFTGMKRHGRTLMAHRGHKKSRHTRTTWDYGGHRSRASLQQDGNHSVVVGNVYSGWRTRVRNSEIELCCAKAQRRLRTKIHRRRCRLESISLRNGLQSKLCKIKNIKKPPRRMAL